MSTNESGLALDEHFDFRIDSSGDIDSMSGVTELQKDLAGAVAGLLKENMGAVLTPTLRAELESLVQSRVAFDDRITDVQSVTVSETTRTDRFSVEIRAESIYGSFELTV